MNATNIALKTKNDTAKNTISRGTNAGGGEGGRCRSVFLFLSAVCTKYGVKLLTLKNDSFISGRGLYGENGVDVRLTERLILPASINMSAESVLLQTGR